jgi:hypothetical protein
MVWRLEPVEPFCAIGHNEYGRRGNHCDVTLFVVPTAPLQPVDLTARPCMR